MLDPEFRCRETTDPPHGYRPVPPPRPSPAPVPRVRWWGRLWRRLRGLLGHPPPPPPRARYRYSRRADLARALADAALRDAGERREYLRAIGRDAALRDAGERP